MKLKPIIRLFAIYIALTVLLCASINAEISISKNFQIKNGFRIIAVEAELFPFNKEAILYNVDLNNESLIEFVDNKMTVYEIVEYTNKDGSYFGLKKDANGNKVPLNKSDKNYYENFLKVLEYTHNRIKACLSEDSPISEISFSLLTDKFKYVRKLYDHTESTEVYGINRNYEKSYCADTQNFITKYDLKKYSNYTNGTLITIDDTFMCKTYEPSENTYKLVKQIAINPDIFDYDTIPMSDNYINVPSYSFYTETGKGYLWGQIDNKIYISGGDKGKFAYKPIIKSGKIFIEAATFLSQLNLIITTNNSPDNSYTIHKLVNYHKKNKVEYIKLNFTYGDKKYFVNEKEYAFTEPPFIASKFYGHYLPLKDICDALRINFKWRDYDKSFLIEMFEYNWMKYE